MKASERLRELADYSDLDMPSDYIDRLDVVTNVLPLIADYVFATEAYFAAHDRRRARASGARAREVRGADGGPR